MKNRIPFFTVLIFVFILFMTVPSFGADNPWAQKLPFENATIIYEITGMETGAETLYIKNHGAYRSKHHDGTTRMLGMSIPSRLLEITNPDWIYSFDLEEKTGTKLTNPIKFYLEEYEKLSGSEKKNVLKNSEELGMSVVKDLNGEVEQNATEILGYSCDRTTVMGMNINIIHQTDLALLTEMNIMGMKSKIAATSIDTGKPDDAVFALPSDINPIHDSEADDVARQMVMSTINTLKEPDGAEKMRAKMKNSPQEGVANPNYPVDQEQESPDEEDAQQGVMDESMQQGLNMLKGLFGN